MQRQYKLWLLVIICLCGVVRAEDYNPLAQAVKVTTLSTMLANDGLGEWGYAALVEVDGKRILFDTGARSDVVLQNAKELGIDLSTVELTGHSSQLTGTEIAGHPAQLPLRNSRTSSPITTIASDHWCK